MLDWCVNVISAMEQQESHTGRKAKIFFVTGERFVSRVILAVGDWGT